MKNQYLTHRMMVQWTTLIRTTFKYCNKKYTKPFQYTVNFLSICQGSNHQPAKKHSNVTREVTHKTRDLCRNPVYNFNVTREVTHITWDSESTVYNFTSRKWESASSAVDVGGAAKSVAAAFLSIQESM